MENPKGVAFLAAAGDGIGAAVARRFAAGGYTICIARRDAGKSAELLDALKEQGVAAFAFSVDLRKEAEVQAIFEKIETGIGPIEVCLFNGGANAHKPLLETSENLFLRAWELACLAGFLVGREAARYMLERGRGTMLFTGATASLRGGAGFAAFASAKFGLRAVAQSMARELGPKNIHVAHLVIDGGVDSEAIHRRLAAKGIDPATLPPDRMLKPQSVAEAYWTVHQQSPDAWTHEIDLRPASETW